MTVLIIYSKLIQVLDQDHTITTSTKNLRLLILKHRYYKITVGPVRLIKSRLGNDK